MSESLEFHLSKLVVVGEMFFAFRKYDVERSGLISPHDVHDVLQRVFGSHTHRAESNIQYLLKGKVEKVAFDDILHSPLAMVITNEFSDLIHTEQNPTFSIYSKERWRKWRSTTSSTPP
eukprot:PhF_6_TR6135/c0_g1_i1/m.9103